MLIKVRWEKVSVMLSGRVTRPHFPPPVARRRHGLLGNSSVDVGEAHLLHRVEVIEIAPVFLEAVRGWQCLGVIAWRPAVRTVA